MALHPADIKNFKTIKTAAKLGHLALMECRCTVTGEYRAVICAVNREGEDFEFVPLAVMAWDNPYDLFEPPVAEQEDA